MTPRSLGEPKGPATSITYVPALTVRQPWAALLVMGAKDVENRPWRARYRGTLLIHAAARPDSAAMRERNVGDLGRYRAAIIGHVELVDVVTDSPSPWAEPGQWHWVVRDPAWFPDPIPCTGRLGLWDPGVMPM